MKLWKMNGLGNDFAVVDARAAPFAPPAEGIVALADRRTGIGFDQLVTLGPPRAGGDVFMGIHNADGGAVSACGNATRCVAALLMGETGREEAVVETAAGDLSARRGRDGRIVVDMGAPRLSPAQIPIAPAAGTGRDLAVPAATAAGLGTGTAVGMGNPHVVFFVEDPAAVDLPAVGPAVEHDPLFPERVNASFAAVRPGGGIVARVWERGAGATLACGTAACAILVAAHLTGRTGRAARVHLPGGALDIAWLPSGTVTMEGPVALEFEGEIDPATLCWRRAADGTAA